MIKHPLLKRSGNNTAFKKSRPEKSHPNSGVPAGKMDKERSVDARRLYLILVQ